MAEKQITCCKCIDHGWKTYEEPIYTDAHENKYCLFHAPVDQKKCGNGKPMPKKLFKNFVFQYIEKRHDASKNLLCNISGTVFPDDIDFSAHYSKDKRLENISLQHAVFSGKAKFEGLTIKGLVLANAKIYGEANFKGVVFEDDPGLDHLTFRSRAYFEKAEFQKGCCFTGSIFEKVAWFSECIFSGTMVFHSIKASRNALRMHKLTKDSLSFVLFPSLEAHQFSFKECPDWPDDFGFENEEKTSKLTLEELYRALKQKAVEEHDQPQVSRWHYREKLMQLKQLLGAKTPESLSLLETVENDSFCVWHHAYQWLRLACMWPHDKWRALTWWYWWASGFGERPRRAGIVLLLLLAPVLAIFLSAELCPVQTFWGRVLAMLQHLMFVTNPKAAPNMPFLAFVVVLLTRILIPLQFTLFALAVRNRFRR